MFLDWQSIVMAESWLHGTTVGDPACAVVHLRELAETPFQARAGRDIRREKTRDYRRFGLGGVARTRGVSADCVPSSYRRTRCSFYSPGK